MAKRKPKAETPAEETEKVIDVPVEEPKAVKPKAVKPKAVEPKVEEPKAEEPKAVEPKVEKPKAVEPKAEAVMTVASVLSSSEMEDGAKIVWLMENAPIGIRGIVAKLVSYNMQMKPGLRVNESVGAGHQFDLFNTVNGIIDTEDYKEFKVKMDALNLVYRRFRGESFKDRYLFRFDLQWSRGAKKLKAFNNLQTVITTLCVPADRADNLKKISLDYALDKTTTGISDTAVKNLKKYYKA